MHYRTTQKVAVAILSILMGHALTGCQSFQDRMPKISAEKLAFWKKKEVTDGSNAQKLVALWSDNVAYGAQFGAKRGLGGRLYFYDDQQKPTKIEGELVVYAYDDDNNPEGNKPDRKFVFTPEEFSQFYSESEFGPSYSVWVPWDDVGNKKCSISLVPIFKSTSGQMLVGEHSRTLLPGKSDRLRETTTTREMARLHAASNDIRRVSFTDADTKEERGSNVRRTSIRMPETMKQRIIDQAEATGDKVEFQEIESVDLSHRKSATLPSSTDESATNRPQYLGLRRPIRLRSE